MLEATPPCSGSPLLKSLVLSIVQDRRHSQEKLNLVQCLRRRISLVCRPCDVVKDIQSETDFVWCTLYLDHGPFSPILTCFPASFKLRPCFIPVVSLRLCPVAFSAQSGAKPLIGFLNSDGRCSMFRKHSPFCWTSLSKARFRNSSRQRGD